jgi:hypothetical protein
MLLPVLEGHLGPHHPRRVPDEPRRRYDQAGGPINQDEPVFAFLQRPLFERYLFAIFDHRPLRVRWVCFDEGNTFRLALSFVSRCIIRKFERVLIRFRPARGVVYGQRNDNNAIDVQFFARRDSGPRNGRKAHVLCESRIRNHMAYIPAIQHIRMRGLLFRRGLVHIKTPRLKIETAVEFRIVDRFDFEDSKALVSLRFLNAGWRIVAFAYADLMIGNSGRIGDTSTASR